MCLIIDGILSTHKRNLTGSQRSPARLYVNSGYVPSATLKINQNRNRLCKIEWKSEPWRIRGQGSHAIHCSVPGIWSTMHMAHICHLNTKIIANSLWVLTMQRSLCFKYFSYVSSFNSQDNSLSGFRYDSICQMHKVQMRVDRWLALSPTGSK